MVLTVHTVMVGHQQNRTSGPRHRFLGFLRPLANRFLAIMAAATRPEQLLVLLTELAPQRLAFTHSLLASMDALGPDFECAFVFSGGSLAG